MSRPKQLVVNADDFGFTPDVNEGIVEAHRRGILTAATLMANGEAFDDAVRLARETPTRDIGAHLVLVGGRSLLTGTPLPETVGKLVAVVSAVCIAALGLLIGVLAKSEEQANVFSLIPMFVLSGLGGAWVPLEYTGAAFQAIGHVSPVAWAMDGFKNITARGLGFNSVLLPAAALFGYALLFFGLALWRFQRVSE